MSTQIKIATTQYSYNRIVIIGNGYDLALGMKTSYHDFLLNYLKTSTISAIKKGYSDQLLAISASSVLSSEAVIDKINRQTDINSLLIYCTNRLFMEFQYHSYLFNEVMRKQNIFNWIDLESLYYDILCDELKLEKGHNKLNRDYERIFKLNSDFDYLTQKLKEYLTSINVDIDPFSSRLNNFSDKMREGQGNKHYNLAHKSGIDTTTDPSEILYLNFNYTPWARKMAFSATQNNNQSFINIHGDITNPENEIIFGYGDDTHEFYKEIEVEDNNELLRKIKSFHYPRTDNYHRLLGFMDKNKYEVFVIGHSCGLSDRTLLKSIFESENCLCVKIFHRGNKDEHFDKSIAISRHFENKQEMRRKILPFDDTAVIPQQNQ